MNMIHKSYLTLLEFIALMGHKYDNICLPMKPNYEYDLLIQKGKHIYKVKTIHTDSKAPSGSYIANLRKSGGYNPKNTQKAPFDKNKVDFLFISTPENKYWIPSFEIYNGRALSLSTCSQFIIWSSSAVELRTVNSAVVGSNPASRDFKGD